MSKSKKNAAGPPSGVSYNATFWNTFAREYGNDQLKDAWLKQFEPTLAWRGSWKQGRVDNSDLFFRMEMNRDQVGYEIGPHTDQSRKWVRGPPVRSSVGQKGQEIQTPDGGSSRDCRGMWAWKVVHLIER